MKLEIVEDKPIPPPKKVVVEMSEAEACIVYWALNYYAVRTLAAALAAANRAAKHFKQFNGKAQYPYDKEFV